MSQLLSYDDDSVLTYHTVPSQTGTDGFEHAGRVQLADIADGRNPDILVIACPVPGCGTTMYVPLTGDEDAQHLHARVRVARGRATDLVSATASVAADVTARGHAVRPRTVEI